MYLKTSLVMPRMVFILLMLLCYSQFAAGEEQEVSVACDEGNISEPILISYGEHTTGCVINPITDLDIFTFSGEAGDEVNIKILSKTKGFDPRLEIRGADGSVLIDTNCNGNPRFAEICSISEGFSLPSTGIFQITISDASINETGGYVLQLALILPLDTSSTLNIDTLAGVNNGENIADTISPATDRDRYIFNGVAGTDIRINLISRTKGFDPRLEIRGVDGSVLIDTNCNGNPRFAEICSISEDLSLASTGTYQIAISDSGINETGGYLVSVQCVFGDCITAPVIAPPICDIQLSQSIYQAGDTVIANVYRLANPSQMSADLEVKVWAGLQAGPSVSLVNLGADGALMIKPGFDTDLGPVPFDTEDLPAGIYKLSCRILDPVTGKLLAIDLNAFEIQ